MKITRHFEALFLLCFLFVSSFHSISAQTSGDVSLPANSLTVGPFLTVNYEIGTDDTITMAIKCSMPGQFFGLGFGTSMTNADIWVFEIVNSGTEVTATDYWATGPGALGPDTSSGGQNNLQLLGYEIASGYTLVKISRALNTGDSQDKVIRIGNNNVIYATAAGSPTLTYHGGSRGTGVMNLVAPAAAPSGTFGDISAPVNSATVGSFLTINWEISSDSTTVTMLIKCSIPGQFFGLGFGTSMTNADIWVFEIVNSGTEVTATDYWATGQGVLGPDTASGGQNNLQLLGYEIASGYTLVKISRALNTGDSKDKVIQVGNNNVIYATATGSPTLAYHGGSKGAGVLNLGGTVAPTEPGTFGDISLPENNFFVGGNLLTVNFEFTNDAIIVALKCNVPNVFFGIGFGSYMTGTDIWVFEISDSGTQVIATDRKALSEGPPSLDTDLGGTQDLELLGYQITPQYTLVKVKRALATGDPNDFVLFEGWVPMIYAHANTRFMSQHADSQKGSVTVPFIDGIQGFVVQDETSNVEDVHGILNIISLGLLVDIGIIAVRVLRGRKFSFGSLVISAQMIHSAIMWTVFIMSNTVIAVLLDRNRSVRGSKLTGEPLKDFHFINGLVMMFLSIVTVVIGVANMLYLRSYKHTPPKLVNVKKLHKYLGFILYIGSKVNIIIGTIFHNDGAWKTPVYIYLAALVGIHLLIQKKYSDGFKFSNKTRNVVQKTSTKPRHVALMKAINDRVPTEKLLRAFPEIKWVQLGNKVYDVTDWTHPGGNFIIQACIGREVGRFLYGNYALESWNFKPHKHSLLAFSQINNFFIGEATNYESVLIPEEGSREIVSCATNEWTITSIKRVSDTISQVNFKSKDFKVKNFGNTLTWLSRHVSVGFVNRKKPVRLYTIAMSLNEPNVNLRKSLFKYFDLIMSGQPAKFVYDNDYLEPQDTLPLFIKNYSNVNGLSKAIHQVNYCEEVCSFRIEGPVSRGLELTQVGAGTQTIICAGTGLLPFVDFLNLFLWKNMYELVKKKAGKAKAQEMNILNIPFEIYMNDVKINFMGSFSNEKDILGLDIISKLAEISDKYELDNFKAKIRGYSNKHIVGVQEKFSLEFLRKHVSLDEKRFYVVGPPKMNSEVPEALKLLGVPQEKIMLV